MVKRKGLSSLINFIGILVLIIDYLNSKSGIELGA